MSTSSCRAAASRPTDHDGSRADQSFASPCGVSRACFRGLFLAKLRAAHQAGRLKFFGVHAHLDDIQAFKTYLAPLRKTEWVVYAKKPFGGPHAVLAYLSRYIHRVAISNHRLISADETGVTFKWKDYRIEGPGRYQTMPSSENLHKTGSRHLDFDRRFAG